MFGTLQRAGELGHPERADRSCPYPGEQVDRDAQLVGGGRDPGERQLVRGCSHHGADITQERHG
jgi:hypothetical protein